MAKIRKTRVYPVVLPSLYDRVIITDVSNFERTRSVRIIDLLNFFDPEGTQTIIDKIIYGSVYWTGVELNHRSTVIRYIIGGQQYDAPVTDLVLEDADPTLNRIDVFAVNTDGEVVVITGTPATNPQEPNIIHGQQLKVCIAYVPAGSSIPQNAFIEQVYNENAQEPTEWDTSKPVTVSDSNVNLATTVDPDLGSVHIFLKAILSDTEFTFTKDSETPILNLSSLYFRLQLKTATDFVFDIKILNGVDSVGALSFSSGIFGFDVSTQDEYVDINIPIEYFQLSGTGFDTIVFNFSTIDSQEDVTFYMDDVQLKYGGDNPNTLQSYLALTDTDDDDYIGKRGYFPSVNKNENGLELIPKLFHEIEGALVKKGSGNTDFKSIESGDTVWFKEVQDVDGETIVLMGDTYDAGEEGGLDKGLANSYKKINYLNI